MKASLPADKIWPAEEAIYGHADGPTGFPHSPGNSLLNNPLWGSEAGCEIPPSTLDPRFYYVRKIVQFREKGKAHPSMALKPLAY